MHPLRLRETRVAMGGKICLMPFSWFTVALGAEDVVACCLSSLCSGHFSFVFMRLTCGERPASRCMSSVALATDQLIVLISSLACPLATFFLIFLLLHCHRPCSAVSKKKTLQFGRVREAKEVLSEKPSGRPKRWNVAQK